MNEQEVQRVLAMLASIDEIIRERAGQVEEGQVVPFTTDEFQGLVHQKEGLQDHIQQLTGHRAHWTEDGYQLDEDESAE